MPSPSRARAPCWRAEVLLACYGGTFDPVHRGHVAIALAVADALQAPVRLLPAADPPHRAPPGASASQRAQMLDLAVDGEARLCVDRRELDRDGPSYTLDTLVDLRREFGPEVALVWVLGMDSVCDLHRWHRWKELLDHAHLLGVERPGASVGQGALAQASPEVAAELEGRRCTPLDLQRRASGGYAELPIRPLRTESATRVRERIASGGEWESLVPPAVARFIRQQGLYGPAGMAGV